MREWEICAYEMNHSIVGKILKDSVKVTQRFSSVGGHLRSDWQMEGLGCQHQLRVPDTKGEDAEFEKKTSCWCDGAAGERRIGTLCRRGRGLLVQITNQLLKLWCSAVAAHGNYLEVSKLPMPGSHPQKTWWFWGMDWASEFLQSPWVILVSSQN